MTEIYRLCVRHDKNKEYNHYPRYNAWSEFTLTQTISFGQGFEFKSRPINENERTG